jgi:hypothetical protein
MNSIIKYWNCANGMVSKMNSIVQEIQESLPDLFFISECEIKNSNNELRAINNYNLELSNTLSRGKSRLLAMNGELTLKNLTMRS